MSSKFITRSMASKDACIDLSVDLVMDDDLARNEWPQQIAKLKSEREASGKSISIMAQVMTPELFNKLRNLKTESSGWTIARAINTGTMNETSYVGCHVGDHESYHVFKEFFYPVIERCHAGFKVDGSMKHVADIDPSKIKKQLTVVAESKVISSRVRVARNLEFFPLNPNGTAESRRQIADLMERVFATLNGDLRGTFYRHSNLTDEERQKLIDCHLLFRGRDKMQAASGYHRFWPTGRGIFINTRREFIVWVNEGDHLRIISMERTSNVASVFTRLQRAITAIEHGIKDLTGRKTVFAMDERLGVITCCPSNLGTAMRASVHLNLPAMTSALDLERIDGIARQVHCQVRGSYGDHSAITDSIIDVSNSRRLGVAEYTLMQDLITCVNKLAEIEDDLITSQ